MQDDNVLVLVIHDKLPYFVRHPECNDLVPTSEIQSRMEYLRNEIQVHSVVMGQLDPSIRERCAHLSDDPDLRINDIAWYSFELFDDENEDKKYFAAAEWMKEKNENTTESHPDKAISSLSEHEMEMAENLRDLLYDHDNEVVEDAQKILEEVRSKADSIRGNARTRGK